MKLRFMKVPHTLIKRGLINELYNFRFLQMCRTCMTSYTRCRVKIDCTFNFVTYDRFRRISIDVAVKKETKSCGL